MHSIETKKRELRSRTKRIKKLQILHVIATAFILFVFVFMLSRANSVLTAAGFLVCLPLLIWVIVRLIHLKAEYDKTLAKLKIVELFPSISQISEKDIPEEIIRRMLLDQYKLKGGD